VTAPRPGNARTVGEWFQLYRNLVLLGIMALLIPATFLATQLRTDNAIERWLGENDPAVQQWDRFRERFHLRPQITALFDDILPNDVRVDQTARFLERLPMVDRVWTPTGLRKAIGATQPTGLDALLVPSGNSTVLWIEMNDQAQKDSRETIRQLRLVIQRCDIPIDAAHLGGPLTINAALDEWGRKSLESLLPIVGVVCFLLLWLLRRNLFQSLLLSFSAAFTVLLTFASMQLAGAQMDLLLVALPPLIGVLHLSIGIHLLHHFDAWQQTRLDDNQQPGRSDAVTKAFSETIVPSALATVTTVIGMLSLAISDLGPVRGFGIWSSVGLIYSFAVAYTFLPCFLLDTPFRLPIQLNADWISPRFHWTRTAVFVASLLLLTNTAPGWKHLVPDFNAIGFLPSESRTIVDYTAIEERCCGLVPVELDIDLTEVTSGRERFRILDSLRQRLESETNVTTALSAVSFATGSPVARDLLKHWQSTDGNHFRVSALVRSDANRDLHDIVGDIQTLCQNLTVTVTGLVSLIDESQYAIYTSLRDSLLAAVGVIGLILMIVLRSIPAGLIAMIPNVGPIIVGFGFVGWLDQPLDVGTIRTASVALGIALDDSLHFLHQFRRATAHSSGLEQAVQESWRACAWPMIQTSLVAAVGLAILSFSPFRPVACFGLLMAVLLTVALLADLVLLPYMLTTRIHRLFLPPSSPRSRPNIEPASIHGHGNCTDFRQVEFEPSSGECVK